MLQEDNLSSINAPIPGKLTSNKRKALSDNEDRENDDPSLTLQDVQNILLSQPCTDNDNPSNHTPQRTQSTLQNTRTSKRLTGAKPNERLAETRIKLVQEIKESLRKKTDMELEILKVQLQKEKLNLEISKKQLESYK